jgi:hypothetical protein
LAYGSDSEGSSGTDSKPGRGFPIVKGNIPVEPQLKITGPCTDPIIIFNTVGTAMVFRGLEILAGEYLLIDVPSKQILLNGDFDIPRYSSLSLASSDGWDGWPNLEQGSNSIDFVPATYGSDCRLTITFRDSWM